MPYYPSNEQINDRLFGHFGQEVKEMATPVQVSAEVTLVQPPVEVVKVIEQPKSKFTDSDEYKTTYAQMRAEMDPANPDRALSAGYYAKVGKQTFAVRVTVPLVEAPGESERVIIKCSPWSNGVNDDVDAAEAVALATASGARVISVSPPGIDKGTSRLNREQRRALKNGDFGPLAEAQLAVLLSVYQQVFNEDEPPLEVTVWGSSQGGSNAIALAEKLIKADISVKNLVIGSTPALTERGLIELAAAYFKDGPKTLKAIGRFALPWREPADKDIYKKSLTKFALRMLGRIAGHLWPARALSKGGEADKIENLAIINPSLILDMWVGENDPISPVLRWQALTREVNRYKAGSEAVIHVLPGMPHGVTSDVTAIALMARRLRIGK